MLDGESRYARPQCNQMVLQDIHYYYITMFFCWCKRSFGLFNICATTWVDLRLVADYRWDESSGGKLLTLNLDFVMALDD